MKENPTVNSIITHAKKWWNRSRKQLSNALYPRSSAMYFNESLSGLQREIAQKKLLDKEAQSDPVEDLIVTNCQLSSREETLPLEEVIDMANQDVKEWKLQVTLVDEHMNQQSAYARKKFQIEDAAIATQIDTVNGYIDDVSAKTATARTSYIEACNKRNQKPTFKRTWFFGDMVFYGASCLVFGAEAAANYSCFAIVFRDNILITSLSALCSALGVSILAKWSAAQLVKIKSKTARLLRFLLGFLPTIAFTLLIGWVRMDFGHQKGIQSLEVLTISLNSYLFLVLLLLAYSFESRKSILIPIRQSLTMYSSLLRSLVSLKRRRKNLKAKRKKLNQEHLNTQANIRLEAFKNSEQVKRQIGTQQGKLSSLRSQILRKKAIIKLRWTSALQHSRIVHWMSRPDQIQPKCHQKIPKLDD